MLAVGDSTNLEIIYDSKRSKTTVRKQPRIETNAGKPDKTVRIIADVIERPDSLYPLIMNPYKLDMLQLGDKVRDELSFNITNISEDKVSLSIVSQPLGFFEIELPESISAGKTAKGKIKLLSDSLEKNFEKSFTIELDDEKTTRYTIPVKRSIRKSGGQAKAPQSGKKGK